MLHTLRHSPWQADIEGLLRMLGDGDELLLTRTAFLLPLTVGASLKFSIMPP